MLAAVFALLVFFPMGVPGALLACGAVGLLIALLQPARETRLQHQTKQQTNRWRGPWPWLVGTACVAGISPLLAGQYRPVPTVLAQMAAGFVVYRLAFRLTVGGGGRLWPILAASALLVSVLMLGAVLTGRGGGEPALTLRSRHFVLNGQTHLIQMRVRVERAPVSRTATAGERTAGGRLGSLEPAAAFLTLMLPLLTAAACGPARDGTRLAAVAAGFAAALALSVAGMLPFAWPGVTVGLLSLGAGRLLRRGRAAFLVPAALLAGVLVLAGLRVLQWASGAGGIASAGAFLLWLAALIAFFLVTGRALRRLPWVSLRGRMLIGIAAGLAGHTAGVALTPALPGDQSPFFLCLLLGMGIACAERARRRGDEAACPAR